MKKVLIDTNIYSNAIRGIQYAANIFRSYDQIFFSPIVIGELLSGFKKGNQEKRNTKQLKEFLARPRVVELSISSDTSDYYSFILNQLKLQGTPIPTNDIWIAASAMENGAAIATQDKHFFNIKGIIIVCPE
jgi:tRNA(fMet)-specific endonuclease VapC